MAANQGSPDSGKTFELSLEVQVLKPHIKVKQTVKSAKDFLQKIKRFDYSGDYVLAQGESKEPIKDYTALVDLLDMVSSTFGNVALRLGLEFQG